MQLIAVFFVVSLLSSLFLGPVVIPRLRKLKVGQSIREEGPSAHLAKGGTPIMGGFIFVIAFLAPICLTLNFDHYALMLVVAATLGYGAIGFSDDYIKVVKKHNLGLKAKQKFLMQFAVSAVFVALLSRLSTEVYIPFVEAPVGLGLLFYPVMFFILVGVDNAVNLTDGLDGLAASVTIFVALGYALIAYMQENTVLVAANVGMIGALIGYLKYNWHPAKVFMGDTGSLALGGYVVMMACVLRIPFYLPIIGFVYFVETLSVIIQVAVYKRTKKRVFKMAPLHHHFELCGWREKKIVITFSAVTLLLSMVTVWLYS